MRSTRFLAKCQALSEAGYCPALQPGMFVGRGFADLGFELFTYLGTEQVVSHFTGQRSELTPAKKAQLFVVPSPDELVDEMLRLGFNLRSLEFVDQRHWRLDGLHAVNGESVSAENSNLHEVLIDCLLAALKVRHVSAESR